MGFEAIPSLKTVVENVENVPSATLERIIRESATGGVKRFGKRVEVPAAVLKFFRLVIMDRIREGISVGLSPTQKKKVTAGSWRYKRLCNEVN